VGSAVPGGVWPSQAFAEQQKCNTHLIMGTSFQTFLTEQLKEKLMSLPGRSFAALLLASLRLSGGPHLGWKNRADEEVASQQADRISCSGECFQDLRRL